MTERRPASADRRADSALAKATRNLAERAGRLLEALSPQPQWQPVPVRVRPGRGPSRR